MSTLDELKSQLENLKLSYINITKDFQLKKSSLPLFFGSPDFDDLNALGMQEVRLHQANVLAQGKIQQEITKLQNEQNVLKVGRLETNTNIIPTMPQSTTNIIKTETNPLLIAGGLLLAAILLK